MNNRKAFTLVEVIVILAVVAILAAIAVPLALRIFQNTAQDATATQMQNLQNAMIGNPSLIQSSVRSDFGFLGDLGCLPATLDRLLTQGALPGWSFNSAVQVGAGWNGPYITQATTGQATAGVTIDGWGNSYTYSVSGACPLTGTLTSNGPDGVFSTSDDIIFSMAAAQTTSTVSGYIKDPNGNPVPASTVTINYPGGAAGPGNLTTSTMAADTSGQYSFNNIPFGKRSINVTPKLIVTSARSIPPNTADPNCNTTSVTCSLVEFNLVNFSSSPVSVTSITATYSSACCASPGPWYYRIIWGTAVPFNCTGACGAGSGVTPPFAAQTIAAASTPLSPYTFFVESGQTRVNDINIGRGGEVGTAVRVRLVNFRNCSGANQNCGGNPGGQVFVGGVTITITLSDGSTVRFTP
jgi:prepilin-type N-terminal cleavage/methylation domain-containing protein